GGASSRSVRKLCELASWKSVSLERRWAGVEAPTTPATSAVQSAASSTPRGRRSTRSAKGRSTATATMPDGGAAAGSRRSGPPPSACTLRRRRERGHDLRLAGRLVGRHGRDVVPGPRLLAGDVVRDRHLAARGRAGQDGAVLGAVRRGRAQVDAARAVAVLHAPVDRRAGVAGGGVGGAVGDGLLLALGPGAGPALGELEPDLARVRRRVREVL